MNNEELPIYMLSVEAARAKMEAAAKTRNLECVSDVQTIFVSNLDYKIETKMFIPKNKSDKLIIYFHGGGFTLNSLNTHEFLMRKLANQTNTTVVGVEFRLSPEYPFPVPLNDCISAITYYYNHSFLYGYDRNKIVLAGDSSGGTLALSAQLYLKENMNIILDKLVLIYPPTDYYFPGTRSYMENGFKYAVNRDFLMWCWNNYVQGYKDFTNHYLFPLRAKSFTDMPNTLIIGASQDPLVDEYKKLSMKLTEANVKVETSIYQNIGHGFLMQLGNNKSADDAFLKIVDFIK